MAVNTTVFETIEDVLYGGVLVKYIQDDESNSTKTCASFLDRKLMALDTSIAITIMGTALLFAMKSYSIPSVKRVPRNSNEADSEEEHFAFKRLLLAFMCVMFGVEIGYKISARKLLYILYPCHIMTAVEIFLLTAKISRFSVGVLRLLIPYLYGALLAMLFPDLEDREEFPGMLINFWVQHAMIFFVVPPYLVYIYGIESLEPLKEWAWSCFSGITFGIHHMFILQPLALLTGVNLNSILCPFPADPFNGPYYRLLAVFHQTFCLLTIGKIYSLVLHYTIPRSREKLKAK